LNELRVALIAFVLIVLRLPNGFICDVALRLIVLDFDLIPFDDLLVVVLRGLVVADFDFIFDDFDCNLHCSCCKQHPNNNTTNKTDFNMDN
jgi:hypothetical protein